ncbi:MAG: BrnT family toxin [Oscillospiraceae bacterium]|nr:BrnT family toxin [Oscillospiraceae bacterium]
MQFEWDEEKAALNLSKHGIDFRDAARVFYDINRIEWYDAAHSIDEDRYNTIGKVRNVIFVVYTERRDRTRIISARKATPNERRMYEDGNV